MWAVPLKAGLLFGTGPAQVAAQLALRAQTCSPSPCQGKGQTWAGLRACDAHTGAPPATDSALVAPLVACQGPAAVARHQRGAKGLG